MRQPRLARAQEARAAWLTASIAVALLAVPPTEASAAPALASQSDSNAQAGAADDPLLAAGEAAAAVSFVGSVDVRWSDADGEHRSTLAVQGGNGFVVVQGGTAVMASPQQRLVEHAGGTWDLLWPVTQRDPGRPPPARKYQLDHVAGPLVIGRATRLVEVRQAGTLLERLYLDDQTGLLLRREQFEHGDTPSRSIEFESITFGGTPPAPEPPADVVNQTPTIVPPSHVPSGVSAPVALADGYQRLGLYRRPGVVQVLYSDGLYDLSVFQQQGRLDHHGLPATDRVAIGKQSGWHYPWPGGHVVLWEAGGTVFTAVSDAPLDQIVVAVRSLPPVAGATSLLTRLRQACRALVQPLAA